MRLCVLLFGLAAGCASARGGSPQPTACPVPAQPALQLESVGSAPVPAGAFRGRTRRVDGYGDPLADALVLARRLGDSTVVFRARSDSTSWFVVAERIAPGPYEVRTFRLGFRTRVDTLMLPLPPDRYVVLALDRPPGDAVCFLVSG